MSSRKKSLSRPRPTQSTRVSHAAFFPILVLSFALWLVYRGVFHFPVVFDEVIGKAIFFGLPVWLYVLVSGFRKIGDTFAPYRIRRGLMLGLAVGGIFAFALSLATIWQKDAIYPSFAFLTNEFWWQFFLGLVTSFWETLFFFSFVMLVLQSIMRRSPFILQVIFVTVVFILFHAPNAFLRFQGMQIWYQLMLLALFAIGQALFFAREKNGYALVLSQALWGMALLLHF
jgi:hypothetical protein